MESTTCNPNTKRSPLFNKSVTSSKKLSKSDIDTILAVTKKYKNNPTQELSLNNKIIATLFFEPSTRTRLSFESACYKLGGQVISVTEDKTSSIAKGESLSDTLKVVANYSDLIVIRSPLEGAAELATEVSSVPVINAGDGANEHPTQTLIDLYSIAESQGNLEELHIAFTGDLKFSRTVHSLAAAAAHYPIRMYFVSPESLTLPNQLCHELRVKGVKYSFHKSVDEIIPKLDVLYVTRVQKERFDDIEEYEKVKNRHIVTPETLKGAKPNLRILHPLPRGKEIDLALDNTPYAYYFEQAANGLFVRQALLSLILNEEMPYDL